MRFVKQTAFALALCVLGSTFGTQAQAQDEQVARMRTALSETVVEGIHTNIPLHRELMVDAKFIEGGTGIHYLEGWLTRLKR